MRTPLEKALLTIINKMDEGDKLYDGLNYAKSVCEIALKEQREKCAMLDSERFRYAIYNAFNNGYDAGLKKQMPNPIKYFIDNYGEYRTKKQGKSK